MRKLSLFAAILMFLSAASTVLAQDARSSVQAVLAGMVRNKQFPADLILTGQVTSAGTTQPFRLIIKGKDQMRMEVGTGAAAINTTITKGNGWREAGGKTIGLQPYTARQRPVLVPFLDLLAEADTPGLQTADLGNATIASLPTRRYSLKLPDPVGRNRLYGIPLDEETDVFVDTASGLIARTERWRLSETSMYVRFRHITEFSDYRAVQGLTIPFRIVETVNLVNRPPAQAMYVILTATPNTNIPDSVFAPQEVNR
jgi:hypothetical protein